MMQQKITLGFSTAVVVLAAVLVAMPLFAYSAPTLSPFTQEELDDNWEADRQFPSGGVQSVSFDGRDNVAAIGVIAEDQSTVSQFYYFEGIKKVDNFGDKVSIDLYVPEKWENAETSPQNVGMWVSDSPLSAYPIIVFRNGDDVDAGFYTYDYVFDEDGEFVESIYVPASVAVNYGEWNTLSVVRDAENESFVYNINGEEAGRMDQVFGNIGDYIEQVYLNHYNDGELDYAAYWHAGVEEVEEVSAKAAPAVAAYLLDEAGIAARYGNGRNGGNHIADVAGEMGDDTFFNGVAKEDVLAYECEIVKFLNTKDTPADVKASSECYLEVETVEVDSALIGGADSSVLSAGVEYAFVASGTWVNGNVHTAVDAACRLPVGSTEWEISEPRSLQLQVNKENVGWGTECAPDNTYKIFYSGEGETVNFRVQDGNPPVESWYNDNDGLLTVDIFQKLY